MKNLQLKSLHIYVGISFLVFLVVESLRFFKIPAPDFVFSYVNDFLILPIVGFFCLRFIWWIKKDSQLRLSFFSVLTLVIIYSVYFEVYLPKHSERYTADIWDVFCYAAGGLVFYGLQKLP